MAGTAADPIDLTADETEERQPAAPPTAAAARERHAVAQPAAEPIVGGAKRQPVQAPTPQQGRERMHAMLRHFHLDPSSVDALLKQTQDLIAGGAALHAWLGEPLASFGGDLDVFCGEGSWARWRELLQGAGYAYRPFERKNETITPDQRAVLQEKRALLDPGEFGYPAAEVNGIVQVLDFVRGEGAAHRKVQVVVCLEPEKAPAGFDLSAAATSWDGRRLENPFPWLTRRFLMFWQWEDRPLGRTRLPARRKKYEAKGFTLLPDGGKHVDVPDDPYGRHGSWDY